MTMQQPEQVMKIHHYRHLGWAAEAHQNINYPKNAIHHLKKMNQNQVSYLMPGEKKTGGLKTYTKKNVVICHQHVGKGDREGNSTP